MLLRGCCILGRETILYDIKIIEVSIQDLNLHIIPSIFSWRRPFITAPLKLLRNPYTRDPF